MAGEQQLATGTREGYVEFSVYDASVFVEAVGRKEVKLVALLDSERIDDDVALRALVALHRVDADALQQRITELFKLFADHRNLVAVGHDDAERGVGIEVLTVETADALRQQRHEIRLIAVDFVRNLGLAAVGRGEKEAAVCLQQFVQAVKSRREIVERCLLLMRQWHGRDVFFGIESLAGKVGNLGMHTALVVECADEVGAAGAQLLADESLKEAVLATCQPDGLQLRFGDGCTSVVLLYHGRQLLIVSNKDKLVDVAATHGGFIA